MSEDEIAAIIEAAREVDGLWDAEDGEVIQWQPEAAEALETLRSVIAAATPIDDARYSVSPVDETLIRALIREHDWTTDDKHPYDWCRVCLRVRQADGSSDTRPCKGRSRVELRAIG